MYILACGDAGTPLKDFTWLKEFTHINDYESLRSKAKHNKKYKGKAFIMIDLVDYVDNTSKNIELLKTEKEV